ncbi:carboxypeptidase-like regulatory domain-containing protein [Corallococcus sp. CA053C]|uniref:carboxypeptidase-like regulatory domain-containing protein n=1 Tax=Corallococcus sp. CA053C TaxID=2316732 RepID=UPI0013153BCB|nr:carboxypeptidase-like regulatory domain-containing protein [Corallococcus sp. CA053C]
MRARWWLALGALAVAALLTFFLWGSLSPEPTNTTATAPPAVAPVARAALITTPPRPSGSGRITGLVRDTRGFAASARVSASRTESWRTLSELPCPTVQPDQEGMPVALKDCGFEYRRMMVELVSARLGEADVFAEVATDADGRFVLEGLPEGSVTLWALGDDGVAMQAHVPVGTSDVVLELEEGGYIEGTVTEGDGKTPIPDAQVTLIHREHTRFFDTHTDAQGAFSLGPVPRTTYSLFVAAKGWASRFIPDTRGWHTDTPLRLTRPTRLAGRVVAVDGSPAPGITILLDGDTPLATEQLTTSDGTGHFSFDDVPAVPHQLSATSREASAFATLNVTPPLDAVVLQLEPGVYVEGTVRGDTGQPVAGAKVLTYREDGGPASAEATTVTSVAGRYRLGPVRSGPHTFKVEAAHHQDLELAAQKLQQGMGPLDFTLVRAASAEGIVVDEQGTPLAGIPLQLRSGDEHWNFSYPEDTQLSDAEGHFVLDAEEPGPGFVFTEDTSFLFGALAVQVPAASLRLVLDRGASVSGSVTDAQGLPVHGAALSLGSVQGDDEREELRRSATTDASGRFLLQGIRPGRYVLEATVSRDWTDERASRPIEITGREHVDVSLRLEEGRTLSGMAVDTAGLPLAEVRILATTPDVDDPPWRHQEEDTAVAAGARSGPDGRFTLRHLAATRYALTTDMPGYTFHPERSQGGTFEQKEELWVDAHAEQVRLVFVKDGHLKGRVVDPTGKPVTAFTLSLSNRTSSGAAVEAPDGTFDCPVKGSGTRTFTVRAEGFPALRRAVTTEEGVDLDLGTLTLESHWTLRLHLHDQKTGEPLTEADKPFVEFWSTGARPGIHGRADVRRPTFRNGLFEVEAAPPLPFTVEVTTKGYRDVTRNVTSRDGVLTVPLEPIRSVAEPADP